MSYCFYKDYNGNTIQNDKLELIFASLSKMFLVWCPLMIISSDKDIKRKIFSKDKVLKKI